MAISGNPAQYTLDISFGAFFDRIPFFLHSILTVLFYKNLFSLTLILCTVILPFICQTRLPNAANKYLWRTLSMVAPFFLANYPFITMYIHETDHIQKQSYNLELRTITLFSYKIFL